jgi:hypothetical protein
VGRRGGSRCGAHARRASGAPSLSSRGAVDDRDEKAADGDLEELRKQIITIWPNRVARDNGANGANMIIVPVSAARSPPARSILCR